MVLNGILVFFLGLTAFLFLQYDTFYARQNPKSLIKLLKEETLQEGLAALKSLPPMGGGETDVDPRSFFSFLQSGPPAETALFAVFQSQFGGKETIGEAVTRFQALDEKDQWQSLREAYLVSDRARFTVAFPTLILLISEQLMKTSDSQVIDLIINLKSAELQKLLTERYLSLADASQTNRLLERIQSSSLKDVTKADLKGLLKNKRGVTQ